MKLIAYPMTKPVPDLRPAPSGRAWMDGLPEAYAYRCLPLTIANAHGWEICCTDTIQATWNGGPSKNNIEVVADAGAEILPMTHFGSGILTFHAGYLFRTDPGVSIMVQGPINRPKDGIQALAGVVETDWAPYTFTMNWLFTRPGHTITFEKGEPFCHFFPVGRIGLEAVDPEIRDLAEEPDTLAQHKAWSESRRTFNAELLKPASAARDQKWQKDYYRGFYPNGSEGPADHRTKLRLKPFRDGASSAKDGGDVNDE